MQSISKVERRESKTESGRLLRTSLISQPSHLNSVRRAFTLVELLVVLAVIAFLMALLGVALANMGQQAKEAATLTTIKKIHVQLEQRLDAFDREMERLETYARNGQSQTQAAAYHFRLQQLQTELADEGLTGLSTEVLIILMHKQLMREKFPQIYSDTSAISNSSTASVADSAELLYYILVQAESGGAATVDAGEFLASEIGDTDGDGRQEFIDGWGNPLRFYRWPTRLIRPNYVALETDDPDHVNAPLLIQGLPDHAQESLLKTDPHDPLEQLSGVITFFQSNAPDFESRLHTPNTYFIPLVVSAGADGVLGMGESNSSDVQERLAKVTNAVDIADNITNRNQRAGD